MTGIEATSARAGSPPPERIELSLEGMSCAACAGRIERALAQVPGVAHAGVNFATARAGVTLDGAGRRVTPDTLVAAVDAAGYAARLVGSAALRTPAAAAARADTEAGDSERAARETHLQKQRRALTLAAVFAVPVVVLGNLPMLGGFHESFALHLREALHAEANVEQRLIQKPHRPPQGGWLRHCKHWGGTNRFEGSAPPTTPILRLGGT